MNSQKDKHNDRQRKPFSHQEYNYSKESPKRGLSNEHLYFPNKKSSRLYGNAEENSLIPSLMDSHHLLRHIQRSSTIHGGQQQITIYNTNIENNLTTFPTQPRQPDFESIRDVLESYYKGILKIRLVSGKTLNLERCYINLAIVEAKYQQEIDREILNNQSQSFVRMQSYENLKRTKSESIIPIEQLFYKRKLLDGSEDNPKKILIQGRAGIGKTTFCKKLVHLFINGEWHDRFEAVLWIPLRELKIFKPRNIEDLMKEKYIPHLMDEEKCLLVRDLIKGIKLGRVLLILDGLDEILQEIQTDMRMASFIEYLFAQNHIIITSRPSGVDHTILPVLDLELETVGFSTNNIKDYVNNVLNEEAARSVMEFIQQTPIIQGLANIPVQLDVICHSWDLLPKDTETLTVTKLYKAMVDKLLCNDAVRVGKTDNGKMISIQLMNGYNERRVGKLMSTELEFLSYLAFVGIKNNQIEFDYHKLHEAIDELNDFRRPNDLPLDLLEILKQTSFLHSVKENIDHQNDNQEQSYHFIHLTFQEYFAAMWLSRYFQIETSNQKFISTDMRREETISFIRHNKYNPRYENVWWMIAGQLEGDALESYFQLLQTSPRDLIGVQHQFLIAGCYKEAQSQLCANSTQHIQSELIQWIEVEIHFRKKSRVQRINGLLNFVPDEILIMAMETHQSYGKLILEELSNRRHLRTSTIEYLIQMMSKIGSKDAILVVNALGNQSIIRESAMEVLNTNLWSQDSKIRHAAVNALGTQPVISKSIMKTLLIALKDQDSAVCLAAINALGSRSTISEPEIAIAALLSALTDQDSAIRIAAIKALGNHSTISEPAIITGALLSAMKDQDLAVNLAAIDALGNHSTISDPEIIIATLSSALEDPSLRIRMEIITILGRLTLPDYIIAMVITALHDRYSGIRFAAVNALGNQPVLSETTATALAVTLHDQELAVKKAATEALVKHSILVRSESEVKYLPPTNQESQRLNKQSTLSESAIAEIITYLQNGDANIRKEAVNVLGSQQILTDSIMLSLIAVLRDQSTDVRREAVNALSVLSKIPESIVEALLSVLQDKNPDVRYAAVYVLRNQTVLPASITEVLVATLQDQNPNVRSLTIHILCNLTTMSEATTMAIAALQDKNPTIRCVAVNALSKQPIMPECIVKQIVATLQDQDPDVRMAAAIALGKQTEASEFTILALITALQDNHPGVRYSATNALCKHPTMSESTMLALHNTLQDKKLHARLAAVHVLSNLPTLSHPTIRMITKMLKDRDFNIIVAAFNAIRNRPILPESIIPTLIYCANNSYKKDFQIEVIGVLGKQSGTSISAFAALIPFLEDMDADVRKAAANALGDQSTMPKLIISLIMATIAMTNGCGSRRSIDLKLHQLYWEFLFYYSYSHHVSMLIQGNRFRVFTEQGFDESEELDETTLRNLKAGFVAAQVSEFGFFYSIFNYQA